LGGGATPGSIIKREKRLKTKTKHVDRGSEHRPVTILGGGENCCEEKAQVEKAVLPTPANVGGAVTLVLKKKEGMMNRLVDA